MLLWTMLPSLVFILSFLTFSKGDSKIFNEHFPNLPSCQSQVYCRGELLETVQLAGIFNDSKTFVDLKMQFDESKVLANFESMMNENGMNPSRDQVRDFVESNFENGDELDDWTLPDYHENPTFLSKIPNETVRNFATKLVRIWPTLARKIKPEVVENINRYSIIPIPNGFVIPGGRFKENYYWDSYWIVKGLLISEMPESVRNMLENFLYMVDTIGFIPNGARIYYLNRSQPPLLTPMVRLYIDATNNLEWLNKYIPLLDKELQWFLTNKTIQVEANGKTYNLAHYDSESGTPRPESFSEDVKTCAPLKNEMEIDECYADLKSGAESGWDFSFRWVFDKNGGNNANRTHIQTRRVIPVDLNSFLARAFQDLAMFYEKLGNYHRFNYWNLKFLEWKTAIHEVLYNEDRGIWFDYDVELKKHRMYFYPSNLAPLWAEIYQPESAQLLGRNAYDYLIEEGVLYFQGGTPTSLNNTGEQWDYPSAWAPLQSILIQGLRKSGYGKAQKMAELLARRWVQANLIGFENTGAMFEKYDAENPGQNGGGGEYTVQTGFGWTNGVALECIVDFLST